MIFYYWFNDGANNVVQEGKFADNYTRAFLLENKSPLLNVDNTLYNIYTAKLHIFDSEVNSQLMRGLPTFHETALIDACQKEKG